MTIQRSGPGVATLRAALRELDGQLAKTGWFETARDAKGVPVATKAAANEFGTARIPARPFMRPAVSENGRKWVDQLGQGAKAVLAGRATPAQVLQTVALGAAGDVATKISEVMSPPLSPRTIKAKGGATKPLVETGQMIQSVTGVVERKGE